LQPYVVCAGDHLASIAYKFGFDADTVWNDPSNAALRELRPDPNILFAGDVLQIPNQDKPPAQTSLQPGSSNSFVAPAATMTITLTFSDPALASQAYTIQELPNVTGATDGNGLMSFTAPVTLSVATITFTTPGTSYPCRIGNLDPIGTLSGIFQRLQNLGFIAADTVFDGDNLDVIRMGLCLFQYQQANPNGPPSAPPSAPSSPPSAPPPPSSKPAPPPASSPPASSPPASSPPASSPPASSPPASSPPASSPPASSPPASGGAPPPSNPDAPPSSLPSVTGVVNGAGLSDTGVLDPQVAQQLVAAHGS
jgi:hypothetical protein